MRRIYDTYEESAKDNKEEGGKNEKGLFDIDRGVDEGKHTVVEDDRDAVVEERLAKDEEVEAGVYLVIFILNLIPSQMQITNFTFISSNMAKTATGSTAAIRLAKRRA